MTLNGALISLITFRILEHACLLKHNQCFLVMVHISIPGDCALVHSAVSGKFNFFRYMYYLKIKSVEGLEKTLHDL